MARRRRSSTVPMVWILLLVAGALAYKYWWPAEATSPVASTPATQIDTPTLQAELASPAKGVKAQPTPASGLRSAKVQTNQPASINQSNDQSAASGASSRAGRVDRIKAGRQALAAGKLVEARTLLNAALTEADDEAMRSALIDDLETIAEETLFSPVRRGDDALVSAHVVRSGESLERIAKRYHVTVGLLARINHIANVNHIRAGQTLKVVQGPFHATVDKNRFDLYVYLSDVLVQRFRVGLGEFGSTPTGEWRVKNKLVNPTYYPPRGGPVVAADDPENPLGERWIGLEGVSGEALGQQKYGIHGTNEPESIGKNQSMGCVRLANADVELLYDLLVPNGSRIIINK